MAINEEGFDGTMVGEGVADSLRRALVRVITQKANFFNQVNKKTPLFRLVSCQGLFL